MGEIVKQRLEKIGMNKSELARRINRTPQNVYNIFKRETIDLEMLEKLGEALNYDFFQYYNKEREKIIAEPSESTASEDKDLKKLEKQVERYKNLFEKMSQERDHLSKENSLLKEINDLLRDKLGKGED